MCLLSDPVFPHIPSECFSFPCGRVCFAITLHSGQSPWLVVVTALPLGRVNFWGAFLGSRPAYYRASTEKQSDTLDVPVPRKAAETQRPRENTDTRIKTFCERRDAENKSSTSLLPPLWGSHDFFPLLNLTVSNLSFLFSLTLGPVPFLCSRSLRVLNYILWQRKHSEGKKKKNTHPVIWGLEEAKLRFI